MNPYTVEADETIGRLDEAEREIAAWRRRADRIAREAIEELRGRALEHEHDAETLEAAGRNELPARGVVYQLRHDIEAIEERRQAVHALFRAIGDGGPRVTR